MHETIKEGKAIIRIKKAEKISKEMDVFYNPIMRHNRDISVLLLSCIENKNMQIGLPLEASGIRGIRLIKELEKGKIKSASFNDYDAKAAQSIKNNLILNKINNFAIIRKNYNNTNNKKNIENNKIDEKIKIHNEDASLFLLNSAGFDYIDVDPFGTSNPFLDAAIKRISRNGILAVTNTDTAALTGTYPKACTRKYWAKAKRDYMMHETGLRILIRKVQLIGMQYEKALFPIFSYFSDHYFRVFFRCLKGKKICDEIASEHGMFNDAGPLWLGNLWDAALTNKMRKFSINAYFSNDKELLKFLKIIYDESKSGVLGFYDIHNAAEKMKLKTIPRKEDIIKKIIKMGHKAASTHFSGTGVRTDISYDAFMGILKE